MKPVPAYVIPNVKFLEKNTQVTNSSIVLEKQLAHLLSENHEFRVRIAAFTPPKTQTWLEVCLIAGRAYNTADLPVNAL